MKRCGAVRESLVVVAYSNTDFPADKSERKSVTDGLLTVDGMTVSWDPRKQNGVSISTMEAEYIASLVMHELLGVRELVGELGIKYSSPMSSRGDSQAVTGLHKCGIHTLGERTPSVYDTY
ncbi:unnamed protein product [Phytophthora fragariaefolia]|uniref:Unnamed protein product n=1 Tax=Phytophthora fragariaefolia TaxID=1490495 RepID=A0A9W7D519_9STRA|nr:unnamed protein product [Phytophthora fragariaefolia]